MSNPLNHFCDIYSGSSVPSAFVLWVMREMPPPFVDSRHAQSRVPQLRTVPFIEDRPVATHQAHRWTTVTSSQNKVLLLSSSEFSLNS